MKISNILIKDAIRTIERSQSRFLSIVLIVALGISFFVGMSATAPDMLETMEEYVNSTNAMDIQIISTAGLTQQDVDVIKSISGVEDAVGAKFVDGVAKIDGNPVNDIDGSEMTIRALELDINKLAAVSSGIKDTSFMNRPQLVEGSWPTSSNQCLIDGSALSTPEEFQIGRTITIEGDKSNIDKSLSNTEYTIVGIIRTPLYISYERGHTTIGTGKLGAFIYIPADNFIDDYYSAMYIRLADSDKYDTYSKEYDAYVKQYTDYINSIAPELLAARVNSLKETYTVQVLESEAEYVATKADVELSLLNAEEQVKTILDIAENGADMLLQYKQEYNDAATKAAETIDASKLEHSTQYAKWESARAKFNETKETVSKYSGAENAYNNAQTEYNVAKLQVSSLLSTVEYLEQLVATTRSALDQFDNLQDGGAAGIIDRFTQSGLVGEEVDQIIGTINSMTAMGTAEEMIAYMEPQLQNFEVKLASSKQELLEAKTLLAEKEVDLQKAGELIEKLKQAEVQLATAEVELADAERQLSDAGYDIQLGELEALSQLSDKKNQINAFETNYNIAKEKAKTIEAEFEAAKKEAEEKLEQARLELDQAKQFLLGLDNAQWMVTNRDDSLLGFEEYEQTAKRTAALSLIFPWFFFIVAALVCLNTMNRMIEEERTRLGTFKALGFTDKEIMFKYLVYAFAASVIGSVSGSFLGFAFFPLAITTAYGILFDVPTVLVSYRLGYALPGLLVSIGSTVFATYYTCYKNLTVVPSTLMRPKAPKIGKRILLEKIPSLWSKFNFTWKVTLRNVFRNAKRFIMATAGVGGCAAMLLAGFGLNYSIDKTKNTQFFADDRIWCYDMQIVLNDSYDTTTEECNAYNVVSQNAFIESAILNYMKVYNSTSSKSEEVLETYLLVPENSAELSTYISLRNRKDKQPLQLGTSGAIITEKLADHLNIGVGDYLEMIISDSQTLNIPVAAITENYAFHYVYVSKELYADLFGTNPRYNYITANFAIDDMSVEQKDALAKELMSEYEISAVAYASQIQNAFENVMNSISYVVVILIVAAGLLAFIVLYNLSVINITERLKEIATIKVLGFDDREVSAYIFRENLILTVIGTIEGLIIGIFLHKIVLYIAEVDIVMFGRGIGIASYLYATILSFAFSLTVNLVLHGKLKKVDMVESLKSIE